MSTTTLPLSLPHITLLISNMHCTSCCETITQLLSTLPSIKGVSTSLLLHTVTFAVDASFGPSSYSGPVTIGKIVKDAMTLLRTEGGFDVIAETADGRSVREQKKLNRDQEAGLSLWSWLGGDTKKSKAKKKAEERRGKHLEHCEVCKAQQEASGDPAVNKPRSDTERHNKNDSEVGGGIIKTTLSIEGMTCASCVNSITSALQSNPSILSVDVNLLGSSGVVRHRSTLSSADVAEAIEDAGFDASIIKSVPEAQAPGDPTPTKWKSVFAIEGMTCASCTGAISNTLKDRDGVETVHIDLLGHSGTIIHSSDISVDEIKDLIEEVGYGAELSSTELLKANSPTSQKKGKAKEENGITLRTVQIRVEGMFCHDCVRKINSFLDSLPVETYTPIALHSPITTITYVPHQPLTIRKLLEGISEVAPEFEAEVVKTQSLSERSRLIQRREVKILAWHCLAAIIFAIPTFIVGIVGMVLVNGHNRFKMYIMRPIWGAANLGTIILWPLATIVQLFYKRTFASMWPHLRRLIPSPLRSKRASPRPLTWRTLVSFGSMDLLVVLSTTVSYFASLAMLIIDTRASPEAESIGTYFDSGVFIIMFILLGRTLEAYAKSRTTDAVSLLGTLRPDTAQLVEADVAATLERSTVTRSVSIDHLEIGDVLLIPPGSLPPTDGILVTGRTTFDESSLTGESHPIIKTAGDEIFTGTVNLTSVITLRVTHLAEDTMLEKIIRAVSDASSRKAPLELIAEKLTGIFVPIIVYFALLVLAIWLALSLTGVVDSEDQAGGRVFFALEFAIACLVVACPCGIGLAVPCANAVGNGVAAKAGILASGGGEAFLAATKIARVVFDKTGTLTVGKSVVTDEEWISRSENGHDLPNQEREDIVKRCIAEVERGSTHPLAVGLVEHLGQVDSDADQSKKIAVHVAETNEIAGRGLKATLEITELDNGQGASTRQDMIIGNVAHMTDHSVVLDAKHHDLVAKWSSEAKSVVLVATRDLPPLAPGSLPSSSTSPLFSLSDPPRPTSASLIAKLRQNGISVSMLSGDNESTARAVGAMVGLGEDEVKGGVGPEGKAEVIREMQIAKTGQGEQGREMVMFVGDGLNDSVALAAADVSVAMGHGSQATLASADFVLLSSDLQSLLPLLRISRKVILRQRLNLIWALLFNVICLPFAAGCFYAVKIGDDGSRLRLTPVWSAVLMALSSVSVVGSSLAMRWGL
ncbi:hypothetical protein I316_07917 [Kwoniella heveanensis BCC8398]|uniref:HMA domain-containing protein n=1 Tax=Kwoniella heveanensis BCC8398 TaxID=1296120 RepID=A0A1B9GHB4_9TREE|nr:hypothetical protein I316_07917 [Kwoniella heveanensis BCC8398]